MNYGIMRCSWCQGSDLYTEYHDMEWGTPEHDDRKLFELLILEGMQAGLSWITILKKRESFRSALLGFDYERLVSLTPSDIDVLMEYPGIIHCRRKLEGVVKNAVAFKEVQRECGSFDAYIWGFTDGEQLILRPNSESDVPSSTALSKRISDDMKKRGFVYVGPVIIYSYMQAIGILNDHVKGCFRCPE